MSTAQRKESAWSRANCLKAIGFLPVILSTVSVVRAAMPVAKSSSNSATALAFHSGIPLCSINSRVTSGGTSAYLTGFPSTYESVAAISW